MDLNRCFVIQPFDNGKFDNRYIDSFCPAIEKAGLKPYRVDKDFSTQIPIEDIDAELRECAIVFADISLNNPNVWFEVGLAIAYKKKIVLVCSDERQDKFPFDIQHRSVVTYKTSSKSDFIKLEKEVTARLVSLMSMKEILAKPDSISGILSEKEISDEAHNLIGVVGELVNSFEGAVVYGEVTERMNKIGYNNLAVNIAVNELLSKRFIITGEESDWNNNSYRVLKITQEGANWLYKNKSRFNLSYSFSDGTDDHAKEDSIPF